MMIYSSEEQQVVSRVLAQLNNGAKLIVLDIDDTMLDPEQNFINPDVVLPILTRAQLSGAQIVLMTDQVGSVINRATLDKLKIKDPKTGLALSVCEPLSNGKANALYSLNKICDTLRSYPSEQDLNAEAVQTRVKSRLQPYFDELHHFKPSAVNYTYDAGKQVLRVELIRNGRVLTLGIPFDRTDPNPPLFFTNKVAALLDIFSCLGEIPQYLLDHKELLHLRELSITKDGNPIHSNISFPLQVLVMDDTPQVCVAQRQLGAIVVQANTAAKLQSIQSKFRMLLEGNLERKIPPLINCLLEGKQSLDQNDKKLSAANFYELDRLFALVGDLAAFYGTLLATDDPYLRVLTASKAELERLRPLLAQLIQRFPERKPESEIIITDLQEPLLRDDIIRFYQTFATALPTAIAELRRVPQPSDTAYLDDLNRNIGIVANLQELLTQRNFEAIQTIAKQVEAYNSKINAIVPLREIKNFQALLNELSNTDSLMNGSEPQLELAAAKLTSITGKNYDLSKDKSDLEAFCLALTMARSDPPKAPVIPELVGVYLQNINYWYALLSSTERFLLANNIDLDPRIISNIHNLVTCLLNIAEHQCRLGRLPANRNNVDANFNPSPVTLVDVYSVLLDYNDQLLRANTSPEIANIRAQCLAFMHATLRTIPTVAEARHIQGVTQERSKLESVHSSLDRYRNSAFADEVVPTILISAQIEWLDAYLAYQLHRYQNAKDKTKADKIHHEDVYGYFILNQGGFIDPNFGKFAYAKFLIGIGVTDPDKRVYVESTGDHATSFFSRTESQTLQAAKVNVERYIRPIVTMLVDVCNCHSNEALKRQAAELLQQLSKQHQKTVAGPVIKTMTQTIDLVSRRAPSASVDDLCMHGFYRLPARGAVAPAVDLAAPVGLIDVASAASSAAAAAAASSAPSQQRQ